MNVYHKREEHYQKCLPDCPDECDSVSYSLSSSFNRFPTPKYSEQLVKNSFLNKTFTDLKSNMTLLRESVLSFSVYYSELKYTEISQLEKLSIVDLICAIGGTLGLFLVASVLSFVEILEAIIATLGIFFNRENKTKSLELF
jgi:hypothetical protein